MNYVLLIYHHEASFAQLTKAERNAVHRECGEWHAALERAGQTKGAAGLQPTSTATTLRVQNGAVTLTDGPFAETKEALGGFELLECRNLDEALAIARAFPALRFGSTVELRPLVPGNDCTEPE